MQFAGVAVTSDANARAKRNIGKLLTTLQGLGNLNLANSHLPLNPSNSQHLEASGASSPIDELLGNLVPGRNRQGDPVHGIIGANNPTQTSPVGNAGSSARTNIDHGRYEGSRHGIDLSVP